MVQALLLASNTSLSAIRRGLDVQPRGVIYAIAVRAAIPLPFSKEAFVVAGDTVM